MPEVIEVYNTALFLKNTLKNKSINDINIIKGRYFRHGSFKNFDLFKNNLPLKVIDVKNKGKFIYIILEKDFYIFNTLGLRGGWCSYKNGKFKFAKLMDRYKNIKLNNLNVSFSISNNNIVYFYDTLSFGTLKIVNNKEELFKKLDSIGPDIMFVSYDIFREQLLQNKNLNKIIINVLMNQKVISGIGNYLRSDILWMSKVNPFQLVKNLSEKDIQNIYKNANILTNEKEGSPENYDRDFFVYRSDYDIYGNKVKSERLYNGKDSRMIYWVENRQKL